MLDGYEHKIKKNISLIFIYLIKILAPILLLVISKIFLDKYGSMKDIMFLIIKFIIIFLDFIAIMIILNKTFNLLYDLNILKTRQHKIKTKQD
ncbi:MAG: hypothetical protein RSB77_02130 [Bacilli bacterium]